MSMVLLNVISSMMAAYSVEKIGSCSVGVKDICDISDDSHVGAGNQSTSDGVNRSLHTLG